MPIEKKANLPHNQNEVLLIFSWKSDLNVSFLSFSPSLEINAEGSSVTNLPFASLNIVIDFGPVWGLNINTFGAGTDTHYTHDHFIMIMCIIIHMIIIK